MQRKECPSALEPDHRTFFSGRFRLSSGGWGQFRLWESAPTRDTNLEIAGLVASNPKVIASPFPAEPEQGLQGL